MDREVVKDIRTRIFNGYKLEIRNKNKLKKLLTFFGIYDNINM